MVMIEKGYVKVESLQVHYKRSGDFNKCGGKTLLLLHEMPLSSDVFDLILPKLATQVTVIAIDLPGFGNSDASPKIDSVIEYARFLWKVLDLIGIEETSILGVHGGASIAIEMADLNPNRVNRLILTGIPLLTNAEIIGLKNGLINLELKKDGTHFHNWWNFFSEKWSEDTPVEIIHHSVMQVMNAGPNYKVGYHAAFDYDPTNSLTRLRHPVLLQVAKGDILASKNNLAMELISSFCKEEIFQISGHLSQRLPQEAATSILNFLHMDFEEDN